MPKPQKISYGHGSFQLSNSKVLLLETFSIEQKKEINQFLSFVKNYTKISLATTEIQNTTTPLLVFKCDHLGPLLAVPNEKTGQKSREAYHIHVTPNKVVVTAKSEAGFYYALLTLRNLIKCESKNVFIPCIDIEDYPAFPYRGVMMDFSHGGLLTEAEIKKQIDFLANWKMNQYYFYNEVSIQMNGYSLINYKAQYSKAMIKRIIAYAKERYVDVIPFVELYGHMHDLLKLEKYSSLGIGTYGHDLDPRNPKVQSLLKDWIKQYVELFPSPFIHIGFDETWETERLSIESDTTILPEKLYLDQLHFVAKILKDHGKTVMVWTDMTKDYPNILSQFPKDLIPVVWEYSTDSSALNKWIKPVTEEKLPFFTMSAVDGWASIYPGRKTFGNMDLCLKASIDHNAIGLMTSVWTDAVQPLVRNSWMFMAYGCTIAWQGSSIERNKFIDTYTRIIFPQIANQMNNALQKMAESQLYLEKCKSKKALGTIVEMWTNPFSDFYLKNTADHLEDYKKARLAAEMAQESLIDALDYRIDTPFVNSLITTARLLQYEATRFLWAKYIVDRWNHQVQLTGRKYGSSTMYYDLIYTAHGLITDMLDFSTQLKEEYRQSWLSENMPYRLGTMLGKFDEEYHLWRELYAKILDYQLHNDIDKQSRTFQETFKMH